MQEIDSAILRDKSVCSLPTRPRWNINWHNCNNVIKKESARLGGHQLNHRHEGIVVETKILCVLRVLHLRLMMRMMMNELLNAVALDRSSNLNHPNHRQIWNPS
jgi:hypothetical protein